MFAIIVVVVVLVAFSERGRTGRRIERSATTPSSPPRSGIGVRRYRLVAFVVSGAARRPAPAAMNMLAAHHGPAARHRLHPDRARPHDDHRRRRAVVAGRGDRRGHLHLAARPAEIVGQWQELIYGILVALAAVFLPRGLHGVLIDGYRCGEAAPPAAAARAGRSRDDEPELVLSDAAPPPTPPDRHALPAPGDRREGLRWPPRPTVARGRAGQRSARPGGARRRGPLRRRQGRRRHRR